MLESSSTAAAAAGQETSARKRYSVWLLPQLSDWVFAAMLGWLFLGPAGAPALLGDGDTGWHILLGEMALETGRLPRTDPFSFTMQGEDWFAWEWLADVALAAAHRWDGLRGVALLGGAAIAATAAMLFRYLLWKGANLFAAIFVTLLVSAGSTMHWLARPHMFTWGFFLAAIWLLDADRSRRTAKLWLLVPLAAVWANVHGGFVALLVTVALFAAGCALEDAWKAVGAGGWARLRAGLPALRRYGAVLLLCLAATAANPYGIELHRHIGAYLQSDFILQHVQEFQSPNFRGEAVRFFQAGLFAALVSCGVLLRRGEFVWALIALAWAHAALTSVRHVPLFLIVAAPLIAMEASRLMNKAARRPGIWQTLAEIARDYQPSPGGRAAPPFGWLAVAALALSAVVLQARDARTGGTTGFPPEKFPAAAYKELGGRLASRRILTSDQWADYLLYRLHPGYLAFIDGRSDFYAPEIRTDYLELMTAGPKWDAVLEKHGFDAALVPANWPLASLLRQSGQWRAIYDDGQAIFFEYAAAAPCSAAEEPPICSGEERRDGSWELQ